MANDFDIAFYKTLGIALNGGPGSGNFNPGQGRGVGKPSNGGSVSHDSRRSPRSIYNGDEITVKIGDKTYTGTLQFKDGDDALYVLTDLKSGDGLVKIPKESEHSIKVTETVQNKEKKARIKQLEEEGLKQKTPKERRTEKQKELIKEFDDKGMFTNDTIKKFLTSYADEDTLTSIKNSIDELSDLGVDISNIKLDKIASGGRRWGTATIDRGVDGQIAYIAKFTGQIYDGNPVQRKEIENTKKGFHTNDTVDGVVRHEMGHIMTYAIASKIFTNREEPKTPIRAHDYAQHYGWRTINRALGYDPDGKDYQYVPLDTQQVREQMSEYGRTNALEALAESWSNPNYSPLTKEIARIMKEDAAKIKNIKNSVKFMNYIIKDEIEICSGYGPKEIEFVELDNLN